MKEAKPQRLRDSHSGCENLLSGFKAPSNNQLWNDTFYTARHQLSACSFINKAALPSCIPSEAMWQPRAGQEFEGGQKNSHDRINEGVTSQRREASLAESAVGATAFASSPGCKAHVCPALQTLPPCALPGLCSRSCCQDQPPNVPWERKCSASDH